MLKINKVSNKFCKYKIESLLTKFKSMNINKYRNSESDLFLDIKK